MLKEKKSIYFSLWSEPSSSLMFSRIRRLGAWHLQNGGRLATIHPKPNHKAGNYLSTCGSKKARLFNSRQESVNLLSPPSSLTLRPLWHEVGGKVKLLLFSLHFLLTIKRIRTFFSGKYNLFVRIGCFSKKYELKKLFKYKNANGLKVVCWILVGSQKMGLDKSLILFKSFKLTTCSWSF